MANLSKPRKVYNFVLVDRELAAKGGVSAFCSYTDREGVFGSDMKPPSPGTAVMYVTSRTTTKDGNVVDVGKWFKLDQNLYNFMVRDGETDIYGRSQYEFLANAPMCEGSPNGAYIGEGEDRIQTGVLFRLMNTDKDAKFALEIAQRKVDAEYSAMKLDEQTLVEMANQIGFYGEPGDQMRHKVYQWAGKRPIEYFEVLKSGDRAVRAIIRKALHEGIFKTKGTVIMWESTIIGSNEDDAVSMLLREKAMLEALQEKVDLKTNLVIKGKPGPKKVAVQQ